MTEEQKEVGFYRLFMAEVINRYDVPRTEAKAIAAEVAKSLGLPDGWQGITSSWLEQSAPKKRNEER